MNPCGAGTELSLTDFCSKQEENIVFEHVYVKKVRNSLSRAISFKEGDHDCIAFLATDHDR